MNSIKRQEMSNTQYIKEEWYDQGRYIGIVDTYPWGEDYFIRNHHFMKDFPIGKSPAEINQVFIEKIKRADR